MIDPFLFIPLAICLSGVVMAALHGLPLFNRRLSIHSLSWLLSLVPLAAFGFILSRLPATSEGSALQLQVAWLPSLGLNASLYFDSLSALFGLLVTGIGTLVVIYAGYYFKHDQSAWRFLTYLLLFMTAMLGLVLAGDLITLFLFWEATSITSFLLIAYKYKDEAARRGAFKSLFITGGGGVALLAGLLFINVVVGSADLATVLGSGDLLRQHDWYPVILILIAFGAFTKSAQTPAHIWLPDAMSAPTPASAYLHSATMVKAGIYLMARLNPALGFTELWFWLLSLAGLTTMLVGAYLGLKQQDLKALLAYSTISQLGVLMMLIGQDTEAAFKALIIGIVAHALYKSALFLIVGIVDHEAGTRDLRRLGGLARVMPASLAIGGMAALSMAGLPPLFGFLAKETLLATVTHPSVPAIVDILFPAAAVVAGALLLAQAGLLIVDTFLGQPRDALGAHEAPAGMLLMPAIPALLSLAIGLLPEPEFVASFFANAAGNVFGQKVKVSLALWTGLNIPLLLSLLAIGLGSSLFLLRQQVRHLQMRLGAGLTFNALYGGTLHLIDRAAYLTTRTQSGQLRHYLSVMLIGLGGLILLLAPLPWPTALPPFYLNGNFTILRLFTLILAAAAATATIFLARDLLAILALGASGLSIAVLFMLEPAPDLALVMIVVDILTTVVLVLALTRLPRVQRMQASEFGFRQSWPGLLRDVLISAGGAVVMSLIALSALVTRPRESVVTPFYEANAKALTGASDIVGAIIVDFRALDTLVEILVFSLAGIGVYTLLHYAARTAGDRVREVPPQIGTLLRTTGIGGARTSPFVRALAYLSLPLSLVLAVTHVIYGHDQPGDGFTAGVIISLAVAFWYVILGYEETQRRLRWLKPLPLIGSGLLLGLSTATVSAVINGAFFSPVDFGQMLGLSLPRGFNLGSAFLFEAAICLSVLGGASAIIDTLGHPLDDDAECLDQLEEIAALETAGLSTLAEAEPAVSLPQVGETELESEIGINPWNY